MFFFFFPAGEQEQEFSFRWVDNTTQLRKRDSTALTNWSSVARA